MKNSVVLLFIIIVASCVNPTARRPLNSKSSVNLLTAYAKESKRLYALENEKIKQLIAKDSVNRYQVSPYGFWYTYLSKKEENAPMPKAGDEVVLAYDIRNLDDQIIYAKELLGLKNYRVDQQDFIPAIQQGIKLMKLGETITFVIPFYNAFGIAGDGNKIGIYQSIKSTVTLINIK